MTENKCEEFDYDAKSNTYKKCNNDSVSTVEVVVNGNSLIISVCSKHLDDLKNSPGTTVIVIE